MRFTLADDSGEVTVVAWNEKALELEKTLKANACLQLGNAKVKETQNGGIEVHVDFTSFVNVQAAALQLTKIASLTENQSVNVEGVVSTVPESKEVTTAKGETVKLMVFELKDDSGAVQVSAWRQHAEALNGLKIGDKLLLENAYVKKGFGDKMELSTRSCNGCLSYAALSFAAMAFAISLVVAEPPKSAVLTLPSLSTLITAFSILAAASFSPR